MFHGEVVRVVRHTDHIALTVQDTTFGDHIPLRVHEQDLHTGETVTIGLGDLVSWEGNTVYWTSKALLTVTAGLVCGQAREVRLRRFGYLG